ncbi:MAG: ATP-binding protein [Candidatus Micrarchaeia archaeon]
MKFIGRKPEMEELKKLEKLSRNKLFLVALYGIRRVGKTRLLLEFIGDKGLYFFVNRNKTSESLLREYASLLKQRKVLARLEDVSSWEEFFKVLIERFNGAIVFDEFQNFYAIDPSIMGVLQKTADLHEKKGNLVLFSGSLLGLLKKSFQDSREPLYGRVKKSIRLNPLPFDSIVEMCKTLKLSPEDTIKAYSIFGGYPKYYVSIEDFDLGGKPFEKILDEFFFIPNAALEEEVKLILYQEFGGRSGIYYSILEAIATGNNTISSIAAYLNKPVPSITRQVDELKNYFEIVRFVKPFEGKRGIYGISHPLIRFWFAYIYKNYSEYAKKSPDFIRKVKTDLNSFYGRSFETVCSGFVSKKLKLEESGRQWGKIPKPAGGGQYEIDLVGVSGKTIYFCEFKWKELDYSRALQALEKLKKTSAFMETNLKPRYCLVAKNIKNKKKLKKEGYLVFDMDDFGL